MTTSLVWVLTAHYPLLRRLLKAWYCVTGQPFQNDVWIDPDQAAAKPLRRWRAVVTYGLWTDLFQEPLTTGGIPIGFDSKEQAEAVAALYPAARMRPIEITGAWLPPSDDLLAGRLVLAYRED